MISTSTQQQYLRLMGIDVWVDKDRVPTVEDPVQDRDSEQPVGSDQGDEPEVWQILQKQVASCVQCDLHRGRKQTVFGVGALDADWMVIGEAPGAEEDRQGEPFVGRAGKLLNSMLEAMGLHRSQIYIANILKCRPPNNRDPKPGEVELCEKYLAQQIQLIQPKVILAVGRIAAQNLLKTDVPIGRMRGQSYVYPGSNIPLVVTYHPAYLLRSPQQKRLSWQDLQLAMRIYEKS